MVDTVRTKSELNGMFADGATGVNTQDLRDLMTSLAVYGGLGSLAKTQITLGTGYEPVDLDGAEVSVRNVTVDTVGKTLQLPSLQSPANLEVLVHCEILFKGAVNQDYNFAVFRTPDGGGPSEVTRLTRTFRVLNANQTVAHSWNTTINASGLDSFQLGVRSNGNVFTLLAGVLRVQRMMFE